MKLFRAAVSILGTVFFIGAFLMAARFETEANMETKYYLNGKVIENTIENNHVILTIKDENGKIYSYITNSVEKLCTPVVMEMHNKGTLNTNDDILVNISK